MSLRLFPGFEAVPTEHCVTGSLKRVYGFHGYPVSEALLLGLGRGLGFVYFHQRGTDPFYGGRANHVGRNEEGLERTAGRRTGVEVGSYTTSSARKAQQTLQALLDAAEPVMVYLDMGLLPYFDLPDDFHFGGHAVVIAGYDPDTRDVLVADGDATPHRVAWDTLEAARGSTFKPFPPQHRWYTFDFAAARPPRPDEVRAAVDEVCQGMLAPPISNLGVRGIRKAAARTRRWPDVLDDEALRRTCTNVAMFIDRRGGTGGGIFRYLYAAFLTEAADLCSEPRFDELARRLRVVGDRWEAVAAGFSEAATAAEPADRLDDITAAMDDIADREQDVWAQLATVTA